MGEAWAEADDGTCRRKRPRFRMIFNCRPFLKWVGGKTQLLEEILHRIPDENEIGTYHEPFVGGGAVFFALQPKRARISDINDELINCYQAVQTSVERLIKDLKRHKYEESYFYDIRNADRRSSFKRWGSVRRASRLIYLNKTCYNGLFRVNARGEFNTPFGRYVNPAIVDEANLRACSDALRKTIIRRDSFESVLKSARPGDFVYFDPPYAPLSATAYFTSYDKEGFGIEMQRKLFDVCCCLHSKGVRFMVSNSCVGVISDLYSRFKIDVVYASRAVNSKADKRGKVAELIIRNY